MMIHPTTRRLILARVKLARTLVWLSLAFGRDGGLLIQLAARLVDSAERAVDRGRM